MVRSHPNKLCEEYRPASQAAVYVIQLVYNLVDPVEPTSASLPSSGHHDRSGRPTTGLGVYDCSRAGRYGSRCQSPGSPTLLPPPRFKREGYLLVWGPNVCYSWACPVYGILAVLPSPAPSSFTGICSRSQGAPWQEASGTTDNRLDLSPKSWVPLLLPALREKRQSSSLYR